VALLKLSTVDIFRQLSSDSERIPSFSAGVNWTHLDISTVLFVHLYISGGESALLWPYEWLIVLAWIAISIVLNAASRGRTTETTQDLVEMLEALEDD
jgi:hypothetical protein